MITETTKQVRKLREEISARDLADIIGTSAEMVRRWQRGDAQPREDRIKQIDNLCVERGISVAPANTNPFGSK